MAGKCTPIVAVLAAVWAILGCVAIWHGTLQFNSGTARLTGSLSSHKPKGSRQNLQRKCEGGAAEVLPQTTRRIYEAKEVVPLTAALVSLAMFATMVSDPWAIRSQVRTSSTLPFGRMMERFEDKLGKWLPARFEKVRAEQMESIARVALVAPVALAIGTRQGGPIYSDANSWDGAEHALHELVIGCVYEGKDSAGNYWPFTALATNANGTYTCRLVGDMFEAEPLWPQVWKENCRRVKYPLTLPEEARRIVG